MCATRTRCWYSLHGADADRRKQLHHVLNAFLLIFPLTATSAELNLSMEGPGIVREGDLIEYRVTLVNEGTAALVGIEVLDKLPNDTDLVDATALPFGMYDSLTGIWTIPSLGTGEKDRTASLTLQVLVHANLLAGADDIGELVNRAEVISPRLDMTEKPAVTSRVICPFCNDWEMLSPRIRTRLSGDEYSYDSVRFVFDVYVANNGPVKSDATVTATYFSVSGGGLGNMQLKPYSPVEITLQAGESRSVRFLTTWEDLPESNYWITADFEVNDVSLHDPIRPNAVSATWKGKGHGGDSSSGGGCTLNPKTGVDPLWLLLVLLPLVRLAVRPRISMILQQALKIMIFSAFKYNEAGSNMKNTVAFTHTGVPPLFKSTHEEGLCLL